jgi:antitoxin component YwqK of YwqJK toxin-antitoxin module
MIEYKVKVSKNGAQEWYLDGKLHREDGPAIILTTGTKEWYKNGELHREDGPAIEYSDGTKKWYLNDEQLTETEWKAKLNKTCDGKVVEIDGIKYKLVEL